jgi:hypothetical protein
VVHAASGYSLTERLRSGRGTSHLVREYPG